MLRAAALWLGLSVPAWLIVWAAERAPSVGLPRLPLRQLIAASCSVFCLAEVPAFFAGVGFHLVRTHSLTVASHSGGSTSTTLLGDLATSLAAGISEEIMVVALPVLAAWRIGEASTSPRLRRAGLVTLVLALTAARMSYHVMYGLAAISLLPWAVICVLLYLRSRAVLPLMIAHAAYDVVLAAVNRIAAHHGLAAAVTVFTALAALARVGALRLRAPAARWAAAA